jgi:hypothetical protein
VARGIGSPKWAGFDLCKALGGRRRVVDQLVELAVRHAATHAVKSSRYRGQQLLVSLVLPGMQKALPALRGCFTSPSRFNSPSRHFSVHPTCEACVADAEVRFEEDADSA